MPLLQKMQSAEFLISHLIYVTEYIAVCHSERARPHFVILSERGERRIPFRNTEYYLFEILRLRLRMTAVGERQCRRVRRFEANNQWRTAFSRKGVQHGQSGRSKPLPYSTFCHSERARRAKNPFPEYRVLFI